MSELKRLTTSFGIGIIKLDIEEPDSTEVLFPARYRTDLDWDTINKLAEGNADFRDFILRVKNDLSSKEVRKEKYERFYFGGNITLFCATQAQLPKEIRDGVVGLTWKMIGTLALYGLVYGEGKIVCCSGFFYS